MDVMINENAVPVPQDVATWGDLLNWLETKYLKAGQCITRFAVDGEETVDYREESHSRQSLSGVERIDVESSKFDVVIRQTLDEFIKELDAALDTNSNTIRLLEARNEQEGYTELGKLLEVIRSFFALSCENLGWIDPPGVEIPRAQIPTTLERTLSQVVSAQESASWLLLCDILQYEITPILESWKAIAQATRAIK